MAMDDRYMQAFEVDGMGSLPGSDALEQAILDAMLHDVAARRWCLANMEPVDFIRPAHQEIFNAITTNEAEFGLSDPALCAAKLLEWGKLETCGGREYIKALAYGDAGVPHSSQVIAHAERIRAYRIQRDIARLAGDVLQQVQKAPHDPRAALAMMQCRTDAICGELQFGRRAQSMREVAGTVIDEIEAERRQPFSIRGLRCGIPDLDNPFGGLGDQALVLILGLSGYGKTTLAGQYVFQTAIDQIGKADPGRLLAYVIEGTTKRFLRRFISWQARVPMQWLKPGGYNQQDADADNRIKAARKALQQSPLHIADDMNRLADIETDIRNHAMHAPILGVMIDHAQLFAREGDNRVAQLEDAATRLQILADEVRAPILLLSQVTMTEGEAHAKHSKGLFEACSLVFQLERGQPGETSEQKRRSEIVWVYNSKARDDDPLPPVELRADWVYKRLYGLNDWSRMYPGKVRETDGGY